MQRRSFAPGSASHLRWVRLVTVRQKGAKIAHQNPVPEPKYSVATKSFLDKQSENEGKEASDVVPPCVFRRRILIAK